VIICVVICHWSRYNIIVLNLYDSTEDKSRDNKDELESILDLFYKYKINICLGTFVANAVRDVLNPPIGYESLHEISLAVILQSGW
jgi:hypothetical protein